MSKTLILGGNGYIGSALYSKIDADSVDLCLFGNNLGYSKVANFNDVDISQYKNIILLAGHSSVQMCEYNKGNAWINNVDYFYNLCEKLGDDQLLIYASSASVYGQKTNICTESDLNINPINHYDLTKINIDIIANKFINDGKNIVGLRFGTVNGYSSNIRSDLMINSMVYSYKTKGSIWVSNSWIKRPILAIDDLVEAVLRIIDSDKKYYGQYNLCSFNKTVDEISETVSQVLGCEIIKSKNTNKVYDFEISNNNFQKDYDFTFKCDIKSVIISMVDADLSLFSHRKDDRLLDSCL
jgi:nucleoside-diphosphate-sugar epimerase